MATVPAAAIDNDADEKTPLLSRGGGGNLGQGGLCSAGNGILNFTFCLNLEYICLCL